MMRSLFFSVLIHGTVVGLVLMNDHQKPTLAPVVIELQQNAERPTPRPSAGLKRTFPSARTKLATQKNKMLFGSSISEIVKKRSLENQTSEDGWQSQEGSPQTSSLNEKDFSENPEDLFHLTDSSYFYQTIFNRIDQNLNLDPKLAQYNHFGQVEVTFTLDFKGQLIAPSIQVRSTDRVLQVHILRSLRKSLAEPVLPELYNKSKKDVIFISHFDYFYGDPENNFKKQKLFAKPQLHFVRSTLTQKTATSLGEQLLSGGVSYDVEAMYDSWKKYNHRKKLDANKYDPFGRDRKDPDYNL